MNAIHKSDSIYFIPLLLILPDQNKILFETDLKDNLVEQFVSQNNENWRFYIGGRAKLF